MLFSQCQRATSMTGTPHARPGDHFVSRRLEEGGACASAVLPPECPDDEDAPPSLSCAYPESPGLMNLMLRMLIFVASSATHHLHSVCTPATIESHAKTCLNITIPPALLGGAPVQKRQCFPVAQPPGAGGASYRLVLRTADDLGVDTRVVYHSTVPGSALVFHLNPSAMSVAALALQPMASSELAVEQTALVAQVLSLMNGKYIGRKVCGKRLLTDAQLERSEAITHAHSKAFLGSLPKRPRYK